MTANLQVSIGTRPSVRGQRAALQGLARLEPASYAPDMPSDNPPDTKQLTYTELGRLRGISRESAERLARRRKWKRTVGNDGQTRVAVPPDWATLAAPDNPEDIRGRRVDPVPSLRAAVEELREQGSALRDQLARESARADREAIRADRAESEVSALRDEIRTIRGISLWSRLRRLVPF